MALGWKTLVSDAKLSIHSVRRIMCEYSKLQNRKLAPNYFIFPSKRCTGEISADVESIIHILECEFVHLSACGFHCVEARMQANYIFIDHLAENNVESATNRSEVMENTRRHISFCFCRRRNGMDFFFQFKTLNWAQIMASSSPTRFFSINLSLRNSNECRRVRQSGACMCAED